MIWGPWCWGGDWQGCTLGDGAVVSLGGMMLGFFSCTLGGGVVSTVLILSGILIGGTVYGLFQCHELLGTYVVEWHRWMWVLQSIA
eukprot:9125449-Ditylum_brightwellii.AAC.1